MDTPALGKVNNKYTARDVLKKKFLKNPDFKWGIKKSILGKSIVALISHSCVQLESVMLAIRELAVKGRSNTERRETMFKENMGHETKSV